MFYLAEKRVAELLELGVDLDTIIAKTGVTKSGGEWHTHNRRSDDALDALLAEAHERKALLDRIEHLAVAIGEDGPARRAGADAKNPSLDGLRAVIEGVEKYARAKGIDIRTDAEKAAPEPTATDRQIDYIVALLEGRARRGEGGGFMSTHGLYKADGTVDRAAVAKMTRRTASAMIDSLRGNY
ncbi:hypothetical protein [Nocardia farcinica]|uniref:Uncharacterized protein n=1 Tax=Nocardia farcinica (strain IFM 10152) TaxID=247156 RepID=Q5YSI1_NOCFA|nr:hypothetical protein [Nocardia farcinica]BAD58860.1 hypothetical protein NFA_40120 [Nocardia farcinica IFM 10152]